MNVIEEKISRAKKLLFESLDILDRSGENRKIYEAKFKAMSQKETVDFFKTGIVRLYTEAYNIEPKIEDAIKLCDKLGVPVMEHITLPYLYDNKGEHLITDKEVMVVPITFRRLQQMIAKENNLTTDISVRDSSNQVMGDSKAARLSDIEVSMLVSKGADKIVTEMLTFRADSMEAKDEAYSNLINTGETNIPDSIKNNTNKAAVQQLYYSYIGMGLMTDLLDVLVD